MGHNHLLNLGLTVCVLLEKLRKNLVDSLKKLGVALGYCNSILLFYGRISLSVSAGVVEGVAGKALGAVSYDVLCGELVNDNGVNGNAERVCRNVCGKAVLNYQHLQQ